MPKTCEYGNCSNPIWSRKTMRCKYHTPFKKTTPKVKEKVYKGVNDLDVKNQIELFEILWDNSNRKSFLSDRPIKISRSSNFWYNIFAHVLSKSKSKYPKFSLYSKNIVLLLPYEHFLLDHGTEDMRKKYAEEFKCDWNKIYSLRDDLRQEYLLLSE